VDPTGTPYVAYRDANNSYKLTVMRFNGTNWEAVGTPGFSDGPVQYGSLDIAINSLGVPYVAYSDISYDKKAMVQRFNGTNWEVVGTI
jgi:hypothetical protein